MSEEKKPVREGKIMTYFKDDGTEVKIHDSQVPDHSMGGRYYGKDNILIKDSHVPDYSARFKTAKHPQ